MSIMLDEGSGPAVVLLHGFCENSTLWSGISNSLKSKYRVLSPDLPGHGNNPLAVDLHSLSDVALEVMNLLDEREITEYSVIGHSLGGYIALAMLEANPERINGLGLFHSTALDDTNEKKRNRSKTIRFIKDNGDKAFKKTFIPSLFYHSGKWSSALADMINATNHETILAYSAMMRDRPERLSLLQKESCNVLYVGGRHDQFISLQSLEKQVEAIKEHVSFYVLENSGHLGMWEEPDESVKIIREFLNQPAIGSR